MGEEEKQPQLYANVCGEWKPVTTICAMPILDAAVSTADYFREAILAPITIRTKLPHYFCCRSRKRLIKLLMANKFSRDEAGRIAQQVCGLGLSYQAAWQQIWPQLLYM